MSLSLAANSLAVAPGVSTSFSAQGGSSPYVFSVAPGGVGGSIDPTVGLYVAPLPPNGSSSIYGTDIVVVTDASTATASLPVVVGNALMLVCDVIQNQMGLSPGQVYLWDQKIDIPNDSRLYVVVALVPKAFGNSTTLDTSGSGISGVQSVNMKTTLSIDIFSRGTDARDRKEEILMAFDSVYAEQQMGLNSFLIAKLSSQFVNLSEVDGAAILYRYNISVNVQYFIKKAVTVPYFDSFSAELEQVEP